MNHLAALKSNDNETLDKLIQQVYLNLLKFEDLVAIGEPSYLKRYNPLTIEVQNNGDTELRLLLLTVIRTGSVIGDKNRTTIPFDAHGLKPGQNGKFRVLAFDPFSEKFDDIEIRLTTSSDWSDRSSSEKWVARASEFTKKLK